MPKFKATPLSRATEFKSEGLYVSNNILFCKWCNCRVDFERRDTVVKHVGGKHHIKVRLGAEGPSSSSVTSSGSKRLATLEEVAEVGKKARESREAFILNTTKAFIAANIPLQKLDNTELRKWINENVKGGGDLPTASSLRKTYVPKLGQKVEAEIAGEFEGSDVCVLCDETTDKGGACVFNILFKKLEPASTQTTKLVASIVLDAANHATCSKAILDTLNRYNIDYNSVKAIVSDSAPYMTKCFSTLSGLLEHAVHVQCWAHKLHLVGNTFQTTLPLLNKTVAKVKKAFLNSRKRKNHYLVFLSEKYGAASGKVNVFPEPVLTRWNSWYRSVCYLSRFLDDILEFFENDDGGHESENSGISWLKDLSATELVQIKIEAEFVSVHCKPVAEQITFLEGSTYPTAHTLTCKLDDLVTKMQLLSVGQVEQFGSCIASLLESLPTSLKKAEQISLLKAAALKAETKLRDLRKKDPAEKMFSSLGALLNPRKITQQTPTNELLQKHMASIPFIKQTELQTFLEGYLVLKRIVVEDLGRPDCSEIDITTLLCSLKTDHLQFSSVCLKALWLPSSNVDSERSFSHYSLVVSDRRRRLLPENAEILTMVNFNKT